jgi:drug/metabolite transporter (DMT)-like permease
MKAATNYALLAAALFGVSRPLAKILVGQSSPFLLAGLLYTGSGCGLAILVALRGGFIGLARPSRHEVPWLLAMSCKPTLTNTAMV